MKRFGIVMLLLVCCIAGAASAQGLQGRSELQFAAAWVDVADLSATFVGVDYAKYISNNVDLELGFLFADADFGGADTSAWAIAPAIAYNFVSENTTNTVPYVGGGFYFFDGDDLDSETGIQAFAGIKFFQGGDYRTANRAFFAEYRYLNDVAGENVNTVFLGITNFF